MVQTPKRVLRYCVSLFRSNHCARKRRHSACSAGDALTTGWMGADAEERRRPAFRSTGAGTRPLLSMSRSKASSAPCSAGVICSIIFSGVYVLACGGPEEEPRPFFESIGDKLRGRCNGSMLRRCPMIAGTSCDSILPTLRFSNCAS